MTNKLRKKWAEIGAILVGRLLQTGMLFLINLTFMLYADSGLYVDTGVAMAWASPLAMVAMFGGYMSATQIKTMSSAKDAAYLQGYLIYRPFLFLCFIILCLCLFVDSNSSFFVFIVTFTTFLALGGISDTFLFYKRTALFITANVVVSLLVGLISLLVLYRAENIVVISCVLMSGVLFVGLLLIRSGIANKTGAQFFMINRRFFMGVNIGPSVILLLSSLSLGVFLAIDRLILPYYMAVSALANYLAAITLALPISFLAIIYGKYTLLNNFHSRFSDLTNARFEITGIAVLVFLGIAILPIQSQIITQFTVYQFDIVLQISINMAACLVVLSKQSLAEIYAKKRQIVVSFINLGLLIAIAPVLIYFASDFQEVGITRLAFNFLYISMIVAALHAIRTLEWRD